MQYRLEVRWQGLRASGLHALTVLGCWRQHEWRSLQGHWYALMARIELARSAPSARQLLHDQLDLLPESRRRLRRNAEARKAIRKELSRTLRGMLQGQA
jgi:hypothetical protein